MARKDETTTIRELKQMLKSFRDAREWKQFHTPKNLTQAISIEANELMQEFLWKTDEEVAELLKDDKFRQKVSYELADVMAFCLSFANSVEIDLSQAVSDKMQENERKYPIEKSKGNAAKYNEL